jgi:hypothetical protein
MGSSTSDEFQLLLPASSGGSGRKLHAVAARPDTSVKICCRSRCWREMSCGGLVCELGWGFGVGWGGVGKSHDLTVELCQPGLAGVVED